MKDAAFLLDRAPVHAKRIFPWTVPRRPIRGALKALPGEKVSRDSLRHEPIALHMSRYRQIAKR